MMNHTETLKGMKHAEFVNFGVPFVAYVKRIDLGGIAAFALHGADGEPLSVEPSEDLAILAARQKNLTPVKVQ